MNLIDILNKDVCEIDLKARDKQDVLLQLANLLVKHEDLKDISADKIYEKLAEREELGTTGFGEGLAIPHCKMPDLEHFVVAIATSSRGVPFEALDGKKTHLFCCIIGPDNQPSIHVQLLASISKSLRTEEHKRELIRAQTKTALYENFIRHLSLHDNVKNQQKNKLVILTVQNEEYFTEIMELFVEMGIKGASVLESNGMGNILTQVPLFASFINFLGEHEKFHRTIITTVPEQQSIRLVENIEEITGNLDKHTDVMVMILDIAFVKGSMETL